MYIGFHQVLLGELLGQNMSNNIVYWEKKEHSLNLWNQRDVQKQVYSKLCISYLQRESTTMRRAEGSDFKEKISKKNKELSEYLDEIRVNYQLDLSSVCVKNNSLIW